MKKLDSILAPNQFLELFPGTYDYYISHLFQADHFAFVVIHKHMVDEIDRGVVADVIETFHAVFANQVFTIYSRARIPDASISADETGKLNLEITRDRNPSPRRSGTSAAVITTFNRPGCLERSLPQVLSLNVPVIIVDDAAKEQHRKANQRIAEQYDAPLILLPSNRGLSNAINVGVSYWLADPAVEWISYFQDDVNVRPDTLKILAQIQDVKDRPLLTGMDDSEHISIKSDMISGYSVQFKRSATGRHLHAHRGYWASVLPVPTLYLGAPKPDKGKLGQGSGADWWITAWSPNSVTKRGGYVICVPGLVSTFDIGGAESTWQNVPATRRIFSRIKGRMRRMLK